VPSRRRIESDAPQGPGENEDDKRVKEQFLDALCGALAAEDMIYFTILLGPAIRR
jgi:hypothetical protein